MNRVTFVHDDYPVKIDISIVRSGVKEGAFAKYFASEVCVKCGNEAVQIMGGYGYTKEYPAEKFLRDAKLMTIGEGTSEIQKLVISREILK